MKDKQFVIFFSLEFEIIEDENFYKDNGCFSGIDMKRRKLTMQKGLPLELRIREIIYHYTANHAEDYCKNKWVLGDREELLVDCLSMFPGMISSTVRMLDENRRRIKHNKWWKRRKNEKKVEY